ncbi:4058_t:CDS:2 [Dentiscutata erythropus]|uniref:4058_t:CDS:1 n=1 Tax=Dentiscutata erythropus TaxID=1348616 RepID=A0A9N8Z075_9GLOM|nr:4058_t:CDS:2 [Dentiscutata erythropus]
MDVEGSFYHGAVFVYTELFGLIQWQLGELMTSSLSALGFFEKDFPHLNPNFF